MILEQAVLIVKPGREAQFEQAFSRAQGIISAMPGYLSHELLCCVEQGNRYLLLVTWNTLEDHTIGFKESGEYQEWKAILHHFYEPFPEVWHFSRRPELSNLPDQASR